MALSALARRCMGIAFADQGAANEVADAMDVLVGSDQVFPEGKDLTFGTTTGTKLGTAVTEKIGFWNATPIVQPSGAAQAALAAYGAGANGLDSGANMSALHALVVAMRLALVNAGIMKGGA